STAGSYTAFVSKTAITVSASTAYRTSLLVYAEGAISGGIGVGFTDGIDQGLEVMNTIGAAGIYTVEGGGTTDAHTSRQAYIAFQNSGQTLYILNGQAEAGTYATPYTATSRAAANLSYALALPDSGALEAWIRPHGAVTGKNYRIWSARAAGTNYFECYYDSATAKIIFQVLDDATNYKQAISTTAFIAGTWNTWIHIKCVWSVSGNAISLYQNGTLQTGEAAEGTIVNTVLPSIFQIGTLTAYGAFELDGLIHDLAIWDTADTSTAHYTAATYWQPSDLMALNRSGSHDLTGGSPTYLYQIPSNLTIDIVFKFNTSYTTSTTIYLLSMIQGAT
ncbi:MAG: LamG-like jellyroll fold domain-containing protein, partial [Phycisphaerales bacterium]|nr:LamG-like jellyroll fold domain-containing protein [Phycisphaerales bacterium]